MTNSRDTGKQAAAYTVATPDYLAYALSLKYSFLKYNPEVNFIICLLGYATHIPAGISTENILCLNALADSRIEGMLRRYSPFEMSAALKPFYAQHIFDQYPECQRLIYLDADMRVYAVLPELSDAAIIITPHRTRLVQQSTAAALTEYIALNRYGVFNTGYFELNRKEACFLFLNWWQNLTETMGFNQPDKNLFTDQLWISLLPSFFDDYYINKLPGYNVAFWNLIERDITKSGEQYLVNNEPLLIFHFSHYQPATSEMMVCYKHDYFNFKQFPHVRQLFTDYLNALTVTGHDQVKDIPYPFAAIAPKPKTSFWKRLVGNG
jgi:hypothetical protein